MVYVIGGTSIESQIKNLLGIGVAPLELAFGEITLGDNSDWIPQR
jgi:hypothetical protein